jgi:20S proteasome alpha/beta subunit
MRTEGYNLGLELLIAGIDGAGVNIAVIANPGQIVALKKLGYAAIGSGAIHALSMFHLGGQDAQMSVAETLVNAYRAKCAADVAPGVGRETDMAIVSATETWPCPPALTHGIKEVHKQYAQRERPDCGEVQKIYESEHGKTA